MKTVSSARTYQIKYESQYGFNHKMNCSNIENELEKLDNWVEQTVGVLNTFLFKSLQDEYEFQVSDQSVQDSIEANEYVFTADGKYAGHLLALDNN